MLSHWCLENMLESVNVHLNVMVGMPAYNEEKRISTVISEIQKHCGFVVVVDDGSNDNTAKFAAASGAKVVMHKVNRGYGGALRTIFKTAREYQPDILIIIDSDGQHNPTDIPRMIDKIKEGYDVVIGSRFLTRESKAQIPSYRKFGMKVLDTATQMATPNIRITDSQSGFRAYSKEAYNLIHLSGDGMSAGSEILVQLDSARMKIAEIPINVRYDLDGTSSQNPLRHGVSVLMNVVRFVTIRRPVLSFGLPGSLALFVGVILAIWAFDIVAQTGIWSTAITLLAALLSYMGVLLIVTGLILYAISQMVDMAVRR